MLIISQDKVANINYDNIEAMYMLKKDDKIEINVRGNYDYTIGIYKTEKRAIQILDEITEVYKDTKTYEYANDALKETMIEEMEKYNQEPFIFRMPKE